MQMNCGHLLPVIDMTLAESMNKCVFDCFFEPPTVNHAWNLLSWPLRVTFLLTWQLVCYVLS